MNARYEGLLFAVQALNGLYGQGFADHAPYTRQLTGEHRTPKNVIFRLSE
jgi:hypothetical protein